MPQKQNTPPKIYDPEAGKPRALERMIVRLGVLAVADKYGVTSETVEKWRRKVHKPSRKTLMKSHKKMF